MKAWKIMLLALALSLSATSFAAAEDAGSGEVVSNERFAIDLQRPGGWAEAGGSERSLFNFIHEPTQSRIEVIATELITSDVASVFFDTFHETLRASEFQNPESEERTFGSIAGTLTRYTLNHAGVNLKVQVFQFERQDVAWLFVLYAEESQEAELSPSFSQMIASFRDRG